MPKSTEFRILIIINYYLSDINVLFLIKCIKVYRATVASLRAASCSNCVSTSSAGNCT